MEHVVLRDLATKFARSTGELALEFAGRPRSITTKSSAVDLVTDADKACERFLVEQIRAARPDDGIVGEEGTDFKSSTGVQWIIDPIDGTTNFVYGMPFYSVSVGVIKDDAPVVGAIYNPVLDEMFSAYMGGGAFLNLDFSRSALTAPV